jgi:hypothetical protein
MSTVAPTARRVRSPSERRAAGALLLVSLSQVVALGRLIEHPWTTKILVPMVIAVGVAHFTSATASRGTRWSIGFVLGGAAGTIAGVLAVNPGLVVPGSGAFLHLALPFHQVGSALHVLSTDGTPLPRGPGVTEVLAAGAAGASAMGRALWQCPTASHRPSSLTWFALAPSVALVVYSSLVSADKDRILAAALYAAAVTVFVVLADACVVPSIFGRSALANRERQSRGAATIAMAALAMLGIVAFGVLLSGMHLNILRINPQTSPRVLAHPTPSTAPPSTVPPALATVPSSAPGGATPTTAPGASLGGGSSRHLHHPPSSFPWWLFVLLAFVLAVLATSLLWRRRRVVNLGPAGNYNQLVVHSFERAQRAVRRMRLERRKSETPEEYRLRLDDLRQQHLEEHLDALVVLAELVGLACFSPQGCSRDQAVDADRVSRQLVQATGRLRFSLR